MSPPKTPHLGFYFTVAAGCTNMVLDVLLVGILHWSVEGAAIATFLSQIVGGLLPIFYFLDHKNTSRLHLRKTQLYSKVLLDACINGSSELMTNLSMSLVNILYNYQLLRLAWGKTAWPPTASSCTPASCSLPCMWATPSAVRPSSASTTVPATTPRCTTCMKRACGSLRWWPSP